MAIMGHHIGKALIDELGLPPHTIGFTLRCYADEVVTVECEYFPDGSPVPALAEYELVRRGVKPAPVHFDTWMRARIDAAHEAMMRRHEVLSAMDARQRYKIADSKTVENIASELMVRVDKVWLEDPDGVRY